MIDNINEKNNYNEEISLKELLLKAKTYLKFLLSKWKLILIFTLVGGSLGLVVSLLTKPKYTAHLTFALVEKSNTGGGLADLSSTFGLGGIGTNGGAFS